MRLAAEGALNSITRYKIWGNRSGSDFKMLHTDSCTDACLQPIHSGLGFCVTFCCITHTVRRGKWPARTRDGIFNAATTPFVIDVYCSAAITRNRRSNDGRIHTQAKQLKLFGAVNVAAQRYPEVCTHSSDLS